MKSFAHKNLWLFADFKWSNNDEEEKLLNIAKVVHSDKIRLYFHLHPPTFILSSPDINIAIVFKKTKKKRAALIE